MFSQVYRTRERILMIVNTLMINTQPTRFMRLEPNSLEQAKVTLEKFKSEVSSLTEHQANELFVVYCDYTVLVCVQLSESYSHGM